MASARILECWWAVLIVLLLLQPAYALDPAWTTSQYLRDRWNTNNGFVGGQVNAIAQTRDGYLWIGAENGLYRYDGIRFVAVEQTYPGAPEIKDVLGLATDSSGDLWIRMRGPTIWRYHNGMFRDILSDNGLKDKGSMAGTVTAMSRCADGAIMFAVRYPTFNDIYLYRDGVLKALASDNVLPNPLIVSLAQTTDNRVWLGTRDDGLFYLNNGVAVSAMNIPAHEKINSLLPLEDGSLLIGSDHGIARWERGAITSLYGPSVTEGSPVVAMMIDRDSNIWVGTERGLLRLNASGSSWVDLHGDGSIQRVTALFEGREGGVWVGCTLGFMRLRDGAFLSYSTREGLPSADIGPIYVDELRSIWFAPSGGGLYRMRDGKIEAVKIDGLNHGVTYSIAGSKGNLWLGTQESGLTNLSVRGNSVTAKTYRQTDGLAQNHVYAVLQSRDGTVWAGTTSGGISSFHNGKFVTYTLNDGLGANIIYSLAEGIDGTIWVGTAGGLSSLSSGHWRNFTAAEDGLPSDDILSLREDREGVLWIGTTSGLAYMDSGTIHSVRDADLALRDPISGITSDDGGSLWIATANHILRVNRDDLLKGHLERGGIREYGISDGLLQVGGVRRDQSVVNDGNGRIWFSTGQGLSVVDWRKQRIDPPPALAHIDAISSDGNSVAVTSDTRIAPSPRRVVIDFTGLNLAAPDRVRYQYRLDGFDPTWTEPTAARQAVYTNLPPGRFSFIVRASNNGLWNGPGAILAFRIAPTLWQTWWFQLLCVLFACFVACLLYRSRVREIAKRLDARFNDRLAERTRIAHQLHDTLLQGLLSASMQLHLVAETVPEDSSAKRQLDHILELMSRVSEEGRITLRGLRASVEDPGTLESALSSIPRELSIPEETDYRVVVDGPVRPLHPAIRDEVYFIGREALVNAVRHAKASSIEVELEYTAMSLVMLVRDNGCGIDPEVLRSGRDGHWGLPGMRERAEGIGAQLRLFSRSQAGTEVELAVPAKIAYEHRSGATWSRRLTNFLFNITGTRRGEKASERRERNGRSWKDSSVER